VSRVDGNAHGRLVETDACARVELPSVPWTTENALTTDGITAGLTPHPRDDRAEAERSAVVGTAVADATWLAVDEEDADLAAADARDQAPLALELRERTDIVPLAHVRTRPSRSP
jgi:hypothetical protein